MSAQPAVKTPYITVEEYLALERAAEYKSEYYNGEIFAMAGAMEPHNLISNNISGELYVQLKPRPCRVYPSDMRLKVSASGLYTYPDVMVVCGEVQFDDDVMDTILNPILIVEVLSKSTESYARGAKFEQYSKLSSLQEYLLVSQYRHRVEQFTKQGSGQWLLATYEKLDEVINLPSISCKLAIQDIYLKVKFRETDIPRLREPIQKAR
jgi:Uma2 family endonuclease